MSLFLGAWAARKSLLKTHILNYLPVFGLELLGKVHGVVDEGKPSGLATTELCLEPEGEAAVGGAGVHLGQLLPHLRIGDVQLTDLDLINIRKLLECVHIEDECRQNSHQPWKLLPCRGGVHQPPSDA